MSIACKAMHNGQPFGYFNSIFGNENWQRFAGGMQTINASLTDFATQAQL